jgi:hypothetical protein
MQIDTKVEQYANVLTAIGESRRPGSNVIVERAEHPVKEFSPMVSTEEGIQIPNRLSQIARA